MKISEDISGLLLIDKPCEWTSFDCVKRIKSVLESGLRARGFKIRHLKVGHSGTLDPFATGLMVVAVGKCTKTVNTIRDNDKDYVFEIVFGVSSPTLDLDVPESEIVFSESPAGGFCPVDPDFLEEILCEFRGGISQVPPAFSALKVDGKRAYHLARAGENFKIESRMVRVDFLDVLENSLKEVSIFSRTLHLPVVKLFATVSKGTYIRSLVRDIGEKLCMPATVLSLRRTRVGRFKLDGDLPVVKFSRETTFEELVASLRRFPTGQLIPLLLQYR